MPRDSSGNYTLPAGNPVASGTVILATWANDTVGDLGNETTNSLSRNGQGGMLAPLQFVDGALLTPGITFVLEPTLGFYRAGVNDMRAAVANRDSARFTLVNQLEVSRDYGGGLTWYPVLDTFQGQELQDQITQNAGDVSLKVNRAGDTMTGQLLGITPVAAADLTRKDYVDAGDLVNSNEASAAQSTADQALSDAAAANNNANTRVLRVGDTMTGQLNGIVPVGAANFTRKDYVDLRVFRSGDTMAGQLNGITPTAAENLTRKDYVDAADLVNANAAAAANNNANTRVLKAGDTMTGQLNGITPVDPANLTRKDWVENAIAAGGVEQPIGALVFGWNPNGLLAGTWVQLPEGTFLMNTIAGADPAGGSNNAVNISHTHTASQPAHTHNYQQGNLSGRGSTGSAGQNEGFITSATTGATPAITVAAAGVAGTNLNKPLYKGVAVWERTA